MAARGRTARPDAIGPPLAIARPPPALTPLKNDQAGTSLHPPAVGPAPARRTTTTLRSAIPTTPHQSYACSNHDPTVPAESHPATAPRPPLPTGRLRWMTCKRYVPSLRLYPSRPIVKGNPVRRRGRRVGFPSSTGPPACHAPGAMLRVPCPSPPGAMPKPAPAGAGMWLANV